MLNLNNPKYGWGWIDGEDDEAGNQWIEISELDYSDPNNPTLDEEICILMLRNANAMKAKYPGIAQQREVTAQLIVNALNNRGRALELEGVIHEAISDLEDGEYDDGEHPIVAKAITDLREAIGLIPAVESVDEDSQQD